MGQKCIRKMRKCAKGAIEMRLSGQTTWNSIKTMKNHVDQPEQACIGYKRMLYRFKESSASEKVIDFK